MITNSDGTISECFIETLSNNSKFFVCKATIDGEVFAMKVFPSWIQAFSTEAFLSHLSHPNILLSSRKATYKDESGSLLNLALSEYCEHGDFFSLLREKNVFFNEKMTRTFFRQLVEAVEYLHENQVYHLDIKPNNILLDGNYNLRLADYDSAHTASNETFYRGTQFFCAPEQLDQYFDPSAADIYLLGVNMFLMFNGGRYAPYGLCFAQMRNLLEREPNLYWKKFRDKLCWESYDWSLEFKDLFTSMTCRDPKKRPTIKQIKDSLWYNGEVYSQSEVRVILAEDLEK